MTNLLLWLLPILSALTAAALAWWLTARWHGRQIETLHGRLDRTRQQAITRLTQARRQIGQLQEELASRPPLSVQQREQRDAAAEAAARRAGLEAGLVAGDARELSAFADTQPMAPMAN